MFKERGVDVSGWPEAVVWCGVVLDCILFGISFTRKFLYFLNQSTASQCNTEHKICLKNIWHIINKVWKRIVLGCNSLQVFM